MPRSRRNEICGCCRTKRTNTCCFAGTHVSIASLPGMYQRTIPIYTFSKSYAMTGLRLGYFAIQDATLRARATKVIAYTTNNVNSVVQYGGIGALEGSQDCIAAFQTELKARRDLFYARSRGCRARNPERGAARRHLLRVCEDQP